MSQLTFQDRKVSDAENIIMFQFTDRLHLLHALHLADGVHQDGNKNLALLGGTIIELVLIKEGLRRRATRGQINKILSERASNTYLAQQGFATGLAKCVYTNPSQGDTVYPKPMVSTVEAVIGAVFNDSGESVTAVEGVMEALGISWPG